MTACIVGTAHTPFGKHDGETVESLIGKVAGAALADAGVPPEDVAAVYLGHFNSGFSDQDFTASLVFQSLPALRFKPAVRMENACATGSAAVHGALNHIEAGNADVVLVVGVEKMTDTPGPQVGENLLHACYRAEEKDIPGGFAGVFGVIAQSYFQRYGDKSAALARIAAKNHANGMTNPLAQFRKDLGFEFCNTVSDKNPLVAGPLRRTDCSPVSDGAAAVVLAGVDAALGMKKAAIFRGRAHVSDFLPMSRRDMTRLEGAAVAWKRALESARLDIFDLDFAETHDCFTVAELMEYEAMGLTAPGRGEEAIDQGWTAKGGKLPVNPSGGLKAKGHPIGATGVSMHALCARQLFGEAGEGQIGGATLSGLFNMGGTSVANYVSILERLR